MKKTIAIGIVSLLAIMFLPVYANAATFLKGQSVYIAEDQTIADNLYAAGNTISLNGNIKGDVICAGQTININGRIEGDVICAGQTININGEVTGNIRTVGNSINLDNKVGRNFLGAGAFINLGSNSQVNEDVILGAGYSEFRGKINRDLIGGGGNMIIGGEIGRDVKLWIDQNVRSNSATNFRNNTPLTIEKNAKVNGSLIYTSGQNANIVDGATIKGETKHNWPKQKDTDKKALVAIYGWMKIVALFGSLIVGMVLVSLWRDENKKITSLMTEKIWPSLGWGAVALFLTPIIIVLLMITMIGLPLALILGGLWLIVLYISKIIAAIAIGRFVVEKWWHKQKDSLIIAMISGVLILWILCLIPVINFVACFLATIWGFGGLWLFFKKA